MIISLVDTHMDHTERNELLNDARENVQKLENLAKIKINQTIFLNAKIAFLGLIILLLKDIILELREKREMKIISKVILGSVVIITILLILNSFCSSP